ncbi:exodeoxyribonuclease V subunit alpha [Marinobacter sp. 1Y8]
MARNSARSPAPSPQQSMSFDPTPVDDIPELFALLNRWAELEWLRALDVSLTRLLASEAETAGVPASPLLLMATALASHQLGRGHVCLDLEAMTAQGFDTLLSLPPERDDAPERSLLPSDVLKGTSAGQWREALVHPLLVADGADPDANSTTPLVRDGLRLYLRRYWRYEQMIASSITQRLAQHRAIQLPDSTDANHLRQALERLFGASTPADRTDWQRVACANAARSGFSVITGGPGTGKTTTVVRLLAALQHVATQRTDKPGELIIRLAAPTGKAAARLNESIAGAIDKLDLTAFAEGDRLKAAITSDVTTLHRLMGSIPGSRRFRHNANYPLLLDVLVIDEASMVDVEMMARVLDALPEHAQLILLGDKDQLASVDAGAVLGDLCLRAAQGRYQQDTVSWLETVSGCPIDPSLVDDQGSALDQSITLLRHSYRFDAASGIGRLAMAVNGAGSENEDASPEKVSALFNEGFADIARLILRPQQLTEQVASHCIQGGQALFPKSGEGRVVGEREVSPPSGYAHYLSVMRKGPDESDGDSDAKKVVDRWAASVLSAHSQFQVLCALRRGPYGVESLNQLIAEALRDQGLIRSVEGWFPGRPVLVTRNDYAVGLMNGDIGIALEVPVPESSRVPSEGDAAPQKVIRVAFMSNDGSGRIKWVLPSRLHAVETVFAMTVHKSQGSEFAHTCLVLPDRTNPILTRELVYTGITRAKYWFSLLMPEESVFRDAIARGVTRTSGLQKALAQPE